MSGRREQRTVNASCVLSRSPLPLVPGTRAGARAGTLARTHAHDGAAVARRREERRAASDAETETRHHLGQAHEEHIRSHRCRVKTSRQMLTFPLIFANLASRTSELT